MTRKEHLLCIMAEECNEVAQEASKALRFGLSKVQSGQFKTNAERIVDELSDLLAVVEMLHDEEKSITTGTRDAVNAKKVKVEKFLRYSDECGTLAEADIDRLTAERDRIAALLPELVSACQEALHVLTPAKPKMDGLDSQRMWLRDAIAKAEPLIKSF